MQQWKVGHNHLKEIEKVGDWTLKKGGSVIVNKGLL